MIYSPLTYLAMRIAYDAHHGVLDKSGAPYIFHPYEVASRLDDETLVAAAFLHDVVEDTDVTFEDLLEKGVPEEVVRILRLLTRDRSEPYMDYIERIGTDPAAAKVKLADLSHNMDASRYCRDMTPRELERQDKYQMAKEYLEGRLRGLRHPVPRSSCAPCRLLRPSDGGPHPPAGLRRGRACSDVRQNVYVR